MKGRGKGYEDDKKGERTELRGREERGRERRKRGQRRGGRRGVISQCCCVIIIRKKQEGGEKINECRKCP